MEVTIWLIVLIICIIVEAISLGLTTIWFAGGALVSAVLAGFGLPIAVQLVAFFVVSLLLLFFTRPIAVKYFNVKRVRTNVEGLIGKQGIVTVDIDNVRATGQVTVNGQEWSARSVDDNVKITSGTVVKVKAINGVKLIVEK